MSFSSYLSSFPLPLLFPTRRSCSGLDDEFGEAMLGDRVNWCRSRCTIPMEQTYNTAPCICAFARRLIEKLQEVIEALNAAFIFRFYFSVAQFKV
ncbi:hypothetical protein ACFX1W_030499 [Malus domestica]